MKNGKYKTGQKYRGPGLRLFLCVIALILLAGLAVTGCTRRSREYKSADGFDPSGPADSEMQMDSLQEAPVAQKSEMRSKLSLDSLADEQKGSWNDQTAPDKQDQQQQEGEVKRIYSGTASLVVDDLDQSKNDVEALAVESGGYVESVYDTSIVVRVPAAGFARIFKAVLELGKVEYQSVETADVTELYSDLSGRFSIAVTSRNRLYELLKRTTDTNQQVLILKEIGRLTEEIENIRLILQNLDNYISYSRISVNLTPRLSMESSDKNTIPFLWLRSLEPLTAVGRTLKARVTLDPGEDYAVFPKAKMYRAESHNGVRIHISTVANRPRGDSRFWQDAILFHLAPFYSRAEKSDHKFGDKDLPGVLLTSKDRDPFVMFVGVITDKGRIHVVQIFSPSEDPAVFDPLFDAFEQGELR